MDARWVLVLLTVASVAGCLDEEDVAVPLDVAVDAYLFDYPGAANWVPGTEHGWLMQLTNPTNQTLSAVVMPLGVADAPIFFGKDRAAMAPPELHLGDSFGGPVAELAPGESTALVMLVREYANATAPWGGFAIHTLLDGQAGHVERVERNVTIVEGLLVSPGDHVQTATVGVWANGTSFYTNIQELNDEPTFPAGYPSGDFGGELLPIYVYNNDRSEQPAGSKDTCHFTTIVGYNDLLKNQAEGGTGARFLEPEEAYTRPGAEDHFLYGEPLIFLNTVVAHDGSTTFQDRAPDPAGACYDPQNILPAGFPPV